MKPMIWHPEEHDKEVNQYLESFNHEPWVGIIAAAIMIVSLFTLLVLIGIF